MPTFTYAAKDQNGRTVEGNLEANSQQDALATLRGQNLTPMRVQAGGAKKGAKKPEAGAAKPAGGGFKLSFGTPKPSTNREELVMFTRQLSTMIGAGLSLIESIEVLADQAETPGLKATCQKLSTELRAGSDLSSSMEHCPKSFSPLYISMVRAGEASGQMDVILERLAEYTEAAEELRREVKSAMTYPVISLALVLGITAFLMIGVVPTFRQVFESLNSNLPKITKITLATSDWMRNSWPSLIGIIAVIAAAFYMFSRTKFGSLFLDHARLKAPIFGPLARKIALARFSRTFATLIRSGVPIMGTLDIVSNTAGNQVVSRAVDDSKESVRNGNMLSEPLSKSKVFPPMVVRMIAIGERSGALEVLLEKIAEFYDGQVKAQIKALTSLIEPLLISFMGIIVGGVVLSVFLPILDIVGKLGQGG